MAGLIAGVLLILAPLASAQSPQPYMDQPDSASTATAPSAPASTQTAVAVSSAAASTTGHGVQVAGAQTAVKLSRPIHAVIHRDSAHWTPVSLRAGGDPGAAETRVLLLISGARRHRRGVESRARAFARVRSEGDERWLVISVFPRAFAEKRRHFEVRFHIVEGYVEGAKAAMVTVIDARPRAGAGLDAEEMTRAGVAFEEDIPDSGEIFVSALDPRPSRSAFNAGFLRGASFANRDTGLADVAWSIRGLSRER